MAGPNRRRTGAFVGGWCTPAQKAKLAALAQLRGQSMNETLVQLIDAAAERAGGVVVEEHPGHVPAAAMQNRDAVTVGGQRVAVPV